MTGLADGASIATSRPEFSNAETARRAFFAGPCDSSGAVRSTTCRRRQAEIAFAGRSNAGKSSLINALTGRQDLARVSNTPGRTREINFFTLGKDHGLYLVDMPGYGYAHASKSAVKGWTRLISDYLRGRAS